MFFSLCFFSFLFFFFFIFIYLLSDRNRRQLSTCLHIIYGPAITWTNHLSGYTQTLHHKQKTMTNFVNYFSSWSQMLQYKEYNYSLINHFSGWPQTLKRKQIQITNNLPGRSRTLQHKQKTLTITWIILFSDCPRTLQHKHKQ